jgi:hypothetical protein
MIETDKAVIVSVTMIENFTHTEHKHEFEQNDWAKAYELFSAICQEMIWRNYG